MEKKNFVSLVLGTVGGLVFGLGMCMCLITEWGAFAPGVAVGAVGCAILLVMVLVRRKMEGLGPIALNGRAVATVLVGVASALILGLRMVMTMVWNMMVPGVFVGIIGIALGLVLIPLIKGLK